MGEWGGFRNIFSSVINKLNRNSTMYIDNYRKKMETEIIKQIIPYAFMLLVLMILLLMKNEKVNTIRRLIVHVLKASPLKEIAGLFLKLLERKK